MLRHRSVAFVLLLVMVALPANGAVCLASCPEAAASASMDDAHSEHHHGATAVVEPSDRLPQLGAHAISGHNCLTHDGSIRTSTEARTSFRLTLDHFSTFGVLAVAAPVSGVPATADADTSSGPPPDLISPTHAPLVLRI